MKDEVKCAKCGTPKGEIYDHCVKCGSLISNIADCKKCRYYFLTKDGQETCIVDLIKKDGAHEPIAEERYCKGFERI